jgi:PAS domain S-box-containing protein
MLKTVSVPERFETVFSMAQDFVTRYFSRKTEDPEKATIEIFGERYILIRAASMSVEFFETVQRLYADEGEEEALHVAQSILFDIAHAIGRSDAANFHDRMNLKDPIEKMSAGPIHFSHAGWAFVEIFPESRPSPDQDYMLVYDHPFSFESFSWLKAGKKSLSPVCIMNAGYSSGWCEESFGIPLAATEIMCKAKGDEACRFIMAPPEKIDARVGEYLTRNPHLRESVTRYAVPGFFQRKHVEMERRREEQALKKAHAELERRVRERTAELERSNRALQDEIEERRRAEQALRDSEERLRAITATAADAIILADDEGRITFWNPAAETIFGYRSEQVVGRELITLIIPDRLQERFMIGLENFRRTGQGPAAGRTMEFTARRKNGSEFPVEISVSSMSVQGRWLALGVMRDVSERKRIEEELFKARKLESIGILAGGLAHDFNNLLTGILGNLSLVRAGTDFGSESQDILEEALKASLQAKGLSSRLLTFAKGGTPVKETISLVDLIKDSSRFALSGSRAVADHRISGDLWPVDADRGQIGQVIQNLVLNADQAMPGGGKVIMGAENVRPDTRLPAGLAPGRYVRLWVRDCGPGIPAEDVQKIFDPYFTTKSRGSGLGLTTVFLITRNHGGIVTVDTGPGKGTTFSIYLPASDREPPAAVMKPSGARQGAGRILVMDDSPVVLRAAKRMMEFLGYEVQEATDGTGVLALYEKAMKGETPFHAVIMDLTVSGGMGGVEALEHLLRLDPHARVVVSSGYADDPVMADFESYGFSGVLTKPYSMEDIGSVLERIIRR